MRPLIKKIFSYFFRGLLALLPLLVTLTVVTWMFKFIERIVDGVIVFIPYYYQNWPWFVGMVEFITAVLLFFGVVAFGLMIRTLFGKRLVSYIDSCLTAIPGVRTVYRSTRQTIELFAIKKDRGIMRTVLIEYPSAGIWSVGFSTGEAGPKLSPDKEHRYYTVFVPTTPNPTSGFCCVMPETRIRFIDISAEDAVKLILTGGMVK
jgi:uncharacterized membrane protein